MKKLFLICGAVCALLTAQAQQAKGPAPAAQPPVADSDTQITLDVNRVNMLFTVSDKKGRFVTNLARDEFEVIESKRPQSIVEF
jgi:hypothetical protein